MQTIYKGKTKDVLQTEEGDIILFFKDDMTGKDGVFDPGENQVGLTVEGSGRSGLRVSTFFFEALKKAHIPTHYLGADLEKKWMQVRPVTFFGQGIEVICRYRAVGSFIKRFGAYLESGTTLPGYVEMTLKDDARQDPFINQEALEILGVMNDADYQTVVALTKKISAVIQAELANKGLELYDIKLEFGKDKKTGEVLLIDELSAGNMRVYKGDEVIPPLELETYLF